MPALLLLPAISAALAPALPVRSHLFRAPARTAIFTPTSRSFDDARMPARSCREPASASPGDTPSACAPALLVAHVGADAAPRFEARSFDPGNPFDNRTLGATLPGMGALLGSGTTLALTGRITLGAGGGTRVGLETIRDQRYAGFDQEQRRLTADPGSFAGRGRTL